jgi:predicted nucleotidyltransferase
MRLSSRVISILRSSIKHSFGDVDLYLFGSRVDDTKRGGDIDLAVDTYISREDFRKKKSIFLATLMRLDFDYKIDVVNFNTNDELLHKEIERCSIKIN